jgi:hypothetical protein
MLGASATSCEGPRHHWQRGKLLQSTMAMTSVPTVSAPLRRSPVSLCFVSEFPKWRG